MTRAVIIFGKAVRRGIGHSKRCRRHQYAKGIEYGERERRPPSHSAVSAGQHQRKWSPTDHVTIRFGPKHYNTRQRTRRRSRRALPAASPLDPRDVLALAGLTGRLDHFPLQRSGGEQQRVAVARDLQKREIT
jgi:ABC-type dipeptide/oligopeptide/nickel transport system ATPase component